MISRLGTTLDRQTTSQSGCGVTVRQPTRLEYCTRYSTDAMLNLNEKHETQTGSYNCSCSTHMPMSCSTHSA